MVVLVDADILRVIEIGVKRIVIRAGHFISCAVATNPSKEFVVVNHAGVEMPRNFGAKYIAEVEHAEGLVGGLVVFGFFADLNHTAEVVVNGVRIFALCTVALSGVLRNDEAVYRSQVVD